MSARAAGNGRVMMNDDGKCKLCVRWSPGEPAGDHPVPFRRHASSKKNSNRPSQCLKWEGLAWVRHSSTGEELDKFKCLCIEAKCREKP